jgi:phenylalanyl-tRNA synthetase alpha chain
MANTAPAGDLALEILQLLSTQEPVLSSDAYPSIPAQDVKSALDRIGSRSMITYETIEREEAVLEAEAEQIVANGSHEARVFEAIRQAVEGLTVQELEQAIGDKAVTKVGQGKAFKEKWISKSSDGKFVASVSSVPCAVCDLYMILIYDPP